MAVKGPFTIALAIGLAASSPLFAQGVSGGLSGTPAGPGVAPVGSVGSTATGTAPDKTGSTTAVGQTKPPGTAVGEDRGTRPDLERKSDELSRRINTGICTGCK